MAISIATNYSGRSASVSTPASTETINRNSSNREAESSLQKQLSLLVLIRCLRTAQLAPPPIVVPFYQNSCHLEPSAILWLGSWYSALVAACEFPSGVLSDVLGRKTTLQLAFIGLGLCWIVTYGSSLSSSSSSMIVVWLGLAQIFRAVGSSLYSGTDMALLYELLKKHKTQNQNQKENPATRKGANGDDLALKLESRQVVLSTITEAVVAALGGLLSRSYGDATVILMSALPPIMGATICFGLEETATSMDGTIQKKEINGSSSRGGGDKSDSTDQSNAPSSETIQKSKFERRRSSRIVDTLNQRSLHIIFGVGVVLNCATYVAATALNPLLWQQVGISNFAGGLLQATNSGVTALGALAAPTLKRLCSRRIGHKIIGSGGGDDDGTHGLLFLLLSTATVVGSGGGGGDDDGTHGLLFLLLSTATVAYGLMTWNAFSQPSPSLESIPSASTSTSLSQTTGAIGASWLLSLVRGLAWPVLGSALNSAIGDNGTRATVLSLFAGAIKIGMVFTGFALGSILHKSSSLGNACALCTSILLGAVAFFVAGLRGWKHGVPPVAGDGGKKDQ
eukprot:CAMPEP_0201251784 /NCGR_PEP_ID=MMETSP0852-20130820/66540_1 /ASSEMBLY_ACC=CAM_ASM_000632 /TAXON_ID=183588 /ORGANISM="Pseudo-nitzschia fraudulenta, Strain WWA7" /LENGTH=566 /DNA_ID=CAMNT_0047551403 /DNA_START=152 /DNA_END=1852 /DNA_ORIENTATION=+